MFLRVMFLRGYIRRRSIVWGAVCFLLLPLPAMAQLQTIVVPALPALPQAEKAAGDPDATYCARFFDCRAIFG